MRILIWGEPQNGGPFDVSRQLDYMTVFQELYENYHASIINVGNKVWIQGIISCLSGDENQLFYLTENLTWEEINASFDCIVYSAANMLSSSHKNLISEVAVLFRCSKIPVYVIAVGAQACSYDELSILTKDICKEVAAFMESIYSTGGEIACRGYFTKELLDSVMPNTAVVTGCPSLYQNGPALSIKLTGGKVRPVINGNLLQDKKLFLDYPDCVCIEQDDWLPETYDYVHYKTKASLAYLSDLCRKRGQFYTDLFLHERIKIFYDTQEWKRFLIEGGFNFSIGSRIHGNIMALLAGIPAMVIPVDSRTREMAEYYNIPLLAGSDVGSLQARYDELDYSTFNRNFQKKYEDFYMFLSDHGLVKKSIPDNPFWERPRPRNADTISNQLQKAKGQYRFITRFGMLPLRAIGKIRKDRNPLLQKIEPRETYRIKE